MEKFLDKIFGFLKRKTPLDYTSFNVGGGYGDMKQDFKLLIKKNKDLLSLNGINLNKVRFVFTPSFLYDVDGDIIDPNYVVMVPTNKRGRFEKSAPIVEIAKPKNVMGVTVRSYKFDDNYEFIRSLVKRTKRGIVIYIIEHQNAINEDGESFDYEFGVDSDVVRLIDLDEAVFESVEIVS